MPNNRYAVSANREREIRESLEKEGWFSVRSSGSHGVADVIAVRPVRNCANPHHFEVKFVQVKTSQKIKEKSIIPEAVDTAIGYINVEYWNFPVKNKAYFTKQRKEKEKAKKKLLQ